MVTGGAGYIGSHTCKVLHQAGYLPVTYDSLIKGHREAVKWGPFEHGDILDTSRLLDVMRQYRPRAVIHFAAFSLVAESVREPEKYYNNNVAGMLSVLECMRVESIKKIVFSSTCAVYGKPQVIPITEKESRKPVNPYGRSKLMVEEILHDYSHAYDMQAVILRYFNAAGADFDCEIGERHDPETHLIPLVLQAALDLEQAFTIFGNDYPTPDGTCIRDYIHVTDLAHAHVLALKHENENNKIAAFNLGTGIGYSVKEIIETVQSVTEQELTVRIGKRRIGDPPALVACADQANRLLKWYPQYSDIRNIVKTAWGWQKSTEKMHNSLP